MASGGLGVESGKAGGGGGKSGGADSDGFTDLYKINQLYFKMLPTLSLVAKRTLLVNYGQKTQYTGTQDTIIITFNTGEFFIAPTTSYLYIQCGYKNPTRYGNSKAIIPHGNILNMFDEVVFTSASGTECERQINKGLYNAASFHYKYKQEYIDTLGDIQGAPTGKYYRLMDGVTPTRASYTAAINLASMYPWLGGFDGIVRPRTGSAAKAQWGTAAHNLNVSASSVVYQATVGGNTIGTPDPSASPVLDYPEFIVPLDQVLGIFKPFCNCLFPAGALSGGRLEFRLKNALEAFQFIGAMPESTTTANNTQLDNLIADANTAFTINKIYLVLDAFQMQDTVLKRLNQIAAGQDGLTLMYDTYDYVVTPFAGSGQVETQVSQARSRIVRSWNVVRDTQVITNPYVDSLASEGAIRRVSAKSAPAAFNFYVPPADDTSTAGIGGGLTYVTVVKGSTTTTDNTPTLVVQDTTTVLGLLEEQGILPDEPYGGPVTAQQTSQPTGDNTYGKTIVSSYQGQLGSNFFPQQPITNAAEHYQNSMYLWGKGIPDKDNTCSVTLEDFLGGLGQNFWVANANKDPTLQTSWKSWVAPYGLAVYGVLAEKSQLLQLSGMPISNARLLRHKFTFQYASASGNRTIATFTDYTRVMKVYLGGRIVIRE